MLAFRHREERERVPPIWQVSKTSCSSLVLTEESQNWVVAHIVGEELQQESGHTATDMKKRFTLVRTMWAGLGILKQADGTAEGLRNHSVEAYHVGECMVGTIQEG